MNKRYQVFVSSTFEDLKEERNEVLQALLELDCIPCGMEYCPAANESQWDYIQKLIDDCDYYIVIIGARYGSLDTDGISFTQKEYNYALSKNIPAIGFIHSNPKSLPINKSDDDSNKKQKLEEFKEIVKQRLCKTWSDAKELGGVVSRSMIQEIRRNPRIGWIKADQVSEDSEKKILQLYKRIEDLEKELSKRELNVTRIQKIDEDLSQGDDIIELLFTLEYGSWGEKKRRKDSVQTSWNEITFHLFPKLIEPVSEATFKSHLTRFLREEIVGFEKYEEASFPNLSLSLSNSSRDSILIQLQAIGLIKTVLIDNPTYSKPDKMIRLTELGEEKLIQQRAIKRTVKS